MEVRRSARPRMVKKKSDIVYFDTQHIELTDQEKDLIYPNEKLREKRYCFCKRTEEEAVGLTMIECDICHDWFHDECIGRRPEELEQLEVYYCPGCSNSKFLKYKKSQPSSADIELLLTALAELDEEKPKAKKKEVKIQQVKIAVFQLSEPILKYPGLVGFIRNESSSLIDDHKSIVPVYKVDIDRGFVWTSWGCYRVGIVEGKFQAASDLTSLGRKTESNDSPVNNDVRVNRLNGFVSIEHQDLVIELPRKNYRFVYDEEKAERLAGVAGSSGIDKIKEYMWSKLKSKSIKELFYS
jgi:hypothetical protein